MSAMETTPAPDGPSDGQNGDGGSVRKGLISINNLNYVLEPDLSVAVNCTHKKHFFQNNSFEGANRTAICIFNSGADYIDTKTSYLQFDVTRSRPYNVVDTCTIGSTTAVQTNYQKENDTFGVGHDWYLNGGSATAFINTLVVSSRSGDELVRIEKLNLLAQSTKRFTYEKAYCQTVGSLTAGTAPGIADDKWGIADSMYEKDGEMFSASGGFVKGSSSLPTTTQNQNYDSRVFRQTPLDLRIMHEKAKLFPLVDTSTRETFVIPMYELCGLFAYDRMLPSMLMSGCRISLEFNLNSSETMYAEHIGDKVTHAHTDATGTGSMGKFRWVSQKSQSWEDEKWGPGWGYGGSVAPPVEDLANAGLGLGARYKTRGDPEVNNGDLKIDNIHFNLKSVQLTDATQRSLNEHSAVHGLEIVYPDFDCSQQDAPNTDFNQEVRKACSRALKAFSVIRDKAKVDRNQTLTDKGQSDEWNVARYQWRLGALYFPHQPVVHAGVSDRDKLMTSKEAYFHALDCFGRIAPNGVYANVTHTEFCRNFGLVACSLERSSLFNLSGVPINNSRILALQMQFLNRTNTKADGSPAPQVKQRTVDTFLKYVKLARVFLNNVEVEQ
jgi:hypothetical protein